MAIPPLRQASADQRMARRPAPVPMTGAELGARVITLEAMMIVMVEAHLDRPEVDETKARSLIDAMRENAVAIAKQFNRPELDIETTKAVDELLGILLRNMPSMKGEFGKVEQQD